MHSRIFQITTEQVERKNYLNENTLEQGDASPIDYCSEIDDDEREQNIAYLVGAILPKGMFTRVGTNIIGKRRQLP
jgi:FKBP-type peptidyl-prolyl cis-trans isomerase (trigger factor)